MTWMTAAQTAAQDSREVLAANLCAEIIEQVIGIRRMNGYLLALGKEGGHEAIDIDELRTKEPKSVGFTLYPTPCCARTSRVYLADLPQGFTRTLSIQPEVVGGENGFFAPQIIWRITARVVFETPRNRGAIERDVALTTLIMDEKRGRDS